MRASNLFLEPEETLMPRLLCFAFLACLVANVGIADAQPVPGNVQGPLIGPGNCSLAAAPQSRDCVANLVVTESPLGRALTDARGYTLYYYDDPNSAAAKDPLSCPYGPNLGRAPTGKISTCIAAWPPVITSDVPATPASLTGTLGVVVRTDLHNIKQVTYNDAPLYYFWRDEAPGDSKGRGLPAFGGHWAVVTVP
jgi:predicted lipoprotein with Yx(FWY)xxD motif